MRDCVRGQAGEFFDRVGQGEEVVFDGNMEGIFVFDVDGHCSVVFSSGCNMVKWRFLKLTVQSLSDFFQCNEVSALEPFVHL